MTIKICVICGEEFTVKFSNHKFCSEKCAKQNKREYHKDYYLKNRKTFRDYFWKNRERRRENNKKRYLKRKLEIDQILGTKCVICDGTYRLICHEIYGKPHSTHKSYILKHPQDFTRLCYLCHKFLHRLAEQTGVSIEVLLVELRKLIQRHNSD